MIITRDPARLAAARAARLAMARAEAMARINDWAGHERSKHITSSPGQEMLYLAKEAEALRYLAQDPEPTDLADFPLIAAEIGITAPTAWQIAQLWAGLSALWRQAAATIEATRLTAARQIAEASTEAEITAALSAFP